MKGCLSDPDGVGYRFFLSSLQDSEVGSVSFMATYFAKDAMYWGDGILEMKAWFVGL